MIYAKRKNGEFDYICDNMSENGFKWSRGALKINLNDNCIDIRNGRSREMATYKERYLAGEIEFEEIDKYSYEWGMSDDERTLAQYLGLNAEEEDAWVSISEEALKGLLDKQRKK